MPRKIKSDLDDLDCRILESLKRDARKTLSDLSKELGVTDVTIATRIRQMQKLGVIRGFIPVLNEEKLGYAISAFIALRIKPGTSDAAGPIFSGKDWVTGIYEIHGFCDMLLKVRARSVAELREYVVKQVGQVPFVLSKEVLTILKVGKENGYASYSAESESSMEKESETKQKRTKVHTSP